MQIESTSERIDQQNVDAIVIGVPEEWQNSQPCRELNDATKGWLSRSIASGEISTNPLKTSTMAQPSALKSRQLILVGLGPLDAIDDGVAFRATGTGAKAAATTKRSSCLFAGFVPASKVDDLASLRRKRSAIAASIVGSEGQRLFRRDPGLFSPERIIWRDFESEILSQGLRIGEAVNFTRRLVNLPANYLYPETFVDLASKELAPLGIECEVWDEKRLATERCGALLGVGQASTFPPRLMIMRYRGSETQSAPIALVGKGVTFDSGGLSIKPTDSMLTMKGDMAGAATVVGIMKCLGEFKPNLHVLGAVGLVENMISGNAFRLGDVLTSRSGKTIEVHNTDAEGRLVLADVLDVVCEQRPSSIIDFATLTGACVVALGNDTAGIMSNNEALQLRILNAASACGEYLWPLPMFDFFSEQIQGKVADLKNMGEGRWGGAITAAKFLEEFVHDGIPWCHLDIAGPAFYDSEKTWQDAGGSGVFVRTFAEMLCFNSAV